MQISILKSKIHRASVTQANLDYVGSITIDEQILNMAGIKEHEKVFVVNINNGQRFETYAIAGAKNSGTVCLNGAAARCVQKKDKIIIMSFCQIDVREVKNHRPMIIFVDEKNVVTEISTS